MITEYTYREVDKIKCQPEDGSRLRTELKRDGVTIGTNIFRNWTNKTMAVNRRTYKIPLPSCGKVSTKNRFLDK